MLCEVEVGCFVVDAGRQARKGKLDALRAVMRCSDVGGFKTCS